MTFTELVHACRERAPQGLYWTVEARMDHFSNSREQFEWIVYRSDGIGHCRAATAEAVLEMAFPVALMTEQMALVGEPTNDDLRAQQAAEQDSRDLHNEVTQGPWPR